jgi:flagella basal body P-ring formation protein FlgA
VYTKRFIKHVQVALFKQVTFAYPGFYKLCATIKKRYVSMNCHIKMPNLTPKAEVTLPQRKWAFFPAAGVRMVLLLLITWPLQAKQELAPEQQLKQHIQQELQQYLNQLGVKARQQDIKLNLPSALSDSHCDNLSISRRQQTEPPLGRVSYTLSCTSPQRWQSRAVAQVKLYLPLVVASRTLERDEVLTADMLSLQELDIGGIRHGLEFEPGTLLGMTVKRRISAGSPVSRHLLQAAYLVQKGAQITVQYRGDGFAVATTAIALSDGQLGERISVQNISSGKVIDAIVTGENNAETTQK